MTTSRKHQVIYFVCLTSYSKSAPIFILGTQGPHMRHPRSPSLEGAKQGFQLKYLDVSLVITLMHQRL